MEVPAIKFQQGRITLYQTIMRGGDLIKISDVDKWDPYFKPNSNQPDEILKQGYQREPIKSHFKKVTKYLERRESPLLPTSVLLSIRGKLNFKVLNKESEIGILTIPEELTLWIVDGQHRIWGLRHAIEENGREEFLNYILPVTIVENMNKVSEVYQFLTINSTQKRVRVDLANRLLTLLQEADPSILPELRDKKMLWRTRAVHITHKLNEREDSPWRGRIRKPNEPKKPGAVATEASFVQSLKPIIKSDVFQGYTVDEITKLLINYWNAIKEFMPEAFEIPEDYVIQKTTGMYTLHMVAPLVLWECIKAHDTSKEGIKKILKKDTDHLQNPDFWLSRSRGGSGAASYTGMGNFRNLADEILEDLGYQVV